MKKILMIVLFPLFLTSCITSGLYQKHSHKSDSITDVYYDKRDNRLALLGAKHHYIFSNIPVKIMNLGLYSFQLNNEKVEGDTITLDFVLKIDSRGLSKEEKRFIEVNNFQLNNNFYTGSFSAKGRIYKTDKNITYVGKHNLKEAVNLSYATTDMSAGRKVMNLALTPFTLVVDAALVVTSPVWVPVGFYVIVKTYGK